MKKEFSGKKYIKKQDFTPLYSMVSFNFYIFTF
jgi:hypothetical protein